MHKTMHVFPVLFAAELLCLQISVPAYQGVARPGTAQIEPVLWRNPGDIASRNLFYGSGGQESMPHGPFSFVEEDLAGTNPKFLVRDRDGVRWQVKLGIEARPETAASRLVWAVGYPTTDDYFFQELRVENVPTHLHRGRDLVAPDGTMHDVRLKRHPGEKKIGLWRWDSNPFVATREYNGLRVMMALINNWDLKDENNSIYREKDAQGSGSREELYMVTDLGASFGSVGRSWPAHESKGNLESYTHSTFIRRITDDDVDLGTPSRPALFYLVGLPEFVRRLELRWIGSRIPRPDAKWIGQLLARLSADQIRDAFRAAGYAPPEVEGFTQVVLKRIAELNGL
jgi:hypothetical protein